MVGTQTLRQPFVFFRRADQKESHNRMIILYLITRYLVLLPAKQEIVHLNVKYLFINIHALNDSCAAERDL